MAVLAVDMGGTNIRSAVFESSDAMGPVTRLPLRQWGFPVPPGEFVEYVARQITAHGQIDAVGLGLAAVIDWRRGHVQVGENIGWQNVPIRTLLERRLNLPVHVEVDAFCGAMGEARLGSGAGVDSFLYVVMGTGIGHGLVLNGELWHGIHGAANVFGHLCVERDGASCYCGGNGCLCQYASGAGIARLAEIYRGSGPSLDGETVIEACRIGEGWAVAAVDEALQHLATALSHAYNLLDIERVIFAGGAVSDVYPHFAKLEQTITPMVYPQIRPIEFRRATLGGDGVLYGAAILALEMIGK